MTEPISKTEDERTEYRPYAWMGEDHDAHVKAFRAIEEYSKARSTILEQYFNFNVFSVPRRSRTLMRTPL